MENSRKLAVDVLEQVLNNKAYSNIALGNVLNKADINSKDKGLITEIVYGTIKYKYTLDKIIQSFLKQNISKLDSYVLNILRCTLYQIIYLDKVPSFAAVDEGVEITKKHVSIGASKLVNGVLRNYLRSKDNKYFNENDDLERLCFNYSFEKWMVDLFIHQYGSKTAEKILIGSNAVPYVTVRVNSIKASYEEAFQSLESNGYNLLEGTICPEAINIVKGKNVEENPLFQNGLITVQDESAMLVAPTLSAEENQTVLDMCSAPGGKTTHISEIMNNTGTVKAFDIHEKKLTLIKSNAARLGINNIVCQVLDASKLDENLVNSADRILVDAPCSGLGIIRKKPEIKWEKSTKQLNSIVDIQKKILSNAAKYIKQNGIIVYSTCTLNKKENEENINWFISQFPQFKIEPLFWGNLENIIYHKEGYATILPNEAMDGFFICKLRNAGR